MPSKELEASLIARKQLGEIRAASAELEAAKHAQHVQNDAGNAHRTLRAQA